MFKDILKQVWDCRDILIMLLEYYWNIASNVNISLIKAAVSL